MNSSMARASSYFALLCFNFVLSAHLYAGGNAATWQTTPSSGDWNTAANWNPMIVPNGNADAASFGTSTITNVSISANTTVMNLNFNAGASAYTITATSSLSLT